MWLTSPLGLTLRSTQTPFLLYHQDKQIRDELMMHVTSRLLQQCRITLFTREHCGLCVSARSVLSDVWDTRPFVFREVDIVKAESKDWKDLYDFDVPVIHISRASAPEEDPKLAPRALKLMHRLTPEQVKAKMDEAEKA